MEGYAHAAKLGTSADVDAARFIGKVQRSVEERGIGERHLSSYLEVGQCVVVFVTYCVGIRVVVFKVFYTSTGG